jgi:hypothetical protein
MFIIGEHTSNYTQSNRDRLIKEINSKCKSEVEKVLKASHILISNDYCTELIYYILAKKIKFELLN